MFLYRHKDINKNLLYVGVSLSVVQRLSQHKSSPWFDQIASVEIENFNSKEDALEAEKKAIKLEKPKYNKMHVENNKGFQVHSFEDLKTAYSIMDVAEELGCSSTAVRKLIASGRLKCIDLKVSKKPIIRILGRHLAEFLEKS